MNHAPQTAPNTQAIEPAPLITPENAKALVVPLYAGRVTAAGEDLAEHAQALAQIISAVRPDSDLLCAAWLFAVHDVIRDADRWLKAHFGPNVAQLVSDLRQLRHLSESVRARLGVAPETAGRGNNQKATQEEALRRMLLAMVNDMRVVPLRLASRLQSLRFLVKKMKGERERHAGESEITRLAADYALETRVLFAPLANRLGLWQFKWELEDIALRILEPATYQELARQLDDKRAQREQRVQLVVTELTNLALANGIQAVVSGRPKHIASIAAKMQAKHLGFERVMDHRAVRVLVHTVAQCYEILALVHQRWKPIPDEMDDYIAKPKANGYQSLHTVVEDDDGRSLEIQIRTQEMHDYAEHGVAAHWRYKESGGSQASGESAETQKVAWLRRLLDWQREVDPGQGPQVSDRVYALTPQGRVVELPYGATAVDFAYQIHTELGHRCRGARIDGALVALNTPLRTGQTVEVVTARTGGPSRDWLNPELGFLVGARGKAKVRQWFHAQEYEQSVAAGRDIINRELQRQGRTAVALDDLSRRLGFASVDEFCAAANTDEFNLRSIEYALAGAPAPVVDEVPITAKASASASSGKGAVLVMGVDSLLTTLAPCCRPIPPDPVIGFITRGKGISVHRANCANARSLMLRQPDRLIEVQWDSQAKSGSHKDSTSFPAEVFVLASDRQGLLRDISEVFAREKLNVTGVNTRSQQDQAQMQFTIEVPDQAALRRALQHLGEVKGVLIARRRI